MKKQLSVVVVGCGYFGLKRIQACLDVGELTTLVGVVDTDKTVAKHVGTLFSVPHAASIRILSRKVDIDAVIVATPNKYHSICVIEAIKLGYHVLCEKPLATTYADAKKIILVAKRHNRFVKTGSNHRLFPTISKAHDLIKNGAIGNILSVRGSIGTNGSRTKNSWFWNKKLSGGGTYIDNAYHLLDITRWFMGDFLSCVGNSGNTFWKNTNVEDVASGIYKTADGRIATITSSWTQWVGYLSLEIWGDKGYILIDSKNGDMVTVGNKDGKNQIIYDFSKKPISSHKDELRYFASCILDNKQPLPSASDGAAVIQMAEGLYKSIKTKRSVVLSTI